LHILGNLLAEPKSTDASGAIAPYHASIVKAGVINGLAFFSREPNAHGFISFAITPKGDEDHQLNIIQMKKTIYLFSWYCNIT
jgi:hypothetical protein